MKYEDLDSEKPAAVEDIPFAPLIFECPQSGSSTSIVSAAWLPSNRWGTGQQSSAPLLPPLIPCSLRFRPFGRRQLWPPKRRCPRDLPRSTNTYSRFPRLAAQRHTQTVAVVSQLPRPVSNAFIEDGHASGQQQFSSKTPFSGVSAGFSPAGRRNQHRDGSPFNRC